MKQKLVFIFFLFPCFIFAQNPQFRGPNRDGIYSESGLLKQWPEQGPQLLMKISGIGDGWSSAVVNNNIIYITGKIDTADVFSAISPEGKILWQTPYGHSWNQSFSNTRSTATIDNGKAYLTSGMGEVVCFTLQDGKIVWRKNTFEENSGSPGNWGVAESLLLDGDKVIFTTGGKKTMMVALDKNNGETLWRTKSLNDNSAYVSPIMIQMNGKKQIVGVSASYIFGVNPANGDIAWTFNFNNCDNSEKKDKGSEINCTSPIFSNGFIYVSSGYNFLGVKLKLKDDLSGAEMVWIDKTLDNHHGGVVLLDGYIYGSNWVSNSKGDWCCINFESGKTMYQTPFKNKGSIIAADGMLYLYTEQPGFVGLVKPNPEKFELVSSFPINEGSGPCWAHPSIYNGKLYIRRGEVLLVYNVKNQ
jgi:outer membrane protein assembly factor BamB